MNPFNLETEYDDYLAGIINKITKSSALNLNDALKELLMYLPNSNFHTDYKIILKTIQPHLDSNGKETINKMIYFLSKKLGVESLKSIQAQWLYYNIDSQDPYAKKLVSDYFDINLFSNEFEKLLKFDDYLKDLHCFKFLIAKSADQHYFDVSKILFQTYLELDLIYEILKIIKGKNPLCTSIESIKRTEESKEKYELLVKEIFYKICEISNSLLISRKYKILFDIYNYFDDKVYHESAHFNTALIKELTEKNTIIDNIAIQSLDQLNVLIPFLKNKEQFILRNLNDSMCIFELMANFNITESLIMENIEKFSTMCEKTIKKHYIMDNCTHYTVLPLDIKPFLIDISNILNGKYKIIAYSILGKSLNHNDFDIKEIDEVMKYSVDVFTKEFFLTNSFSSSCLYFLKKYPEVLFELIKKEKLNDFISKYAATKPEQIVKYITEIDALVKYLSGLPKDEIKKLCFLNDSPKLKIVYLYFLRDEIEQFNVDYSLVFEHFFQIDFLKYLIQKNNNITNFIDYCVKYIESMPFKNTILYSEDIFDIETEFYYNIGLPERDEVFKMLLAALSTSKLNFELEFLTNIIEILLFLPISNFEKLKNTLKIGENEKQIRELFNFKYKRFVVDRLLSNDFKYALKLDTLKINNKKAQDVILRSAEIPKCYLMKLNPSFLSNKGLESAISSILKADSTNQTVDLTDKLKKLNIDTEPDFETLVEMFFEKSNISNILDFVYLIENDEILRIPEFRNERLPIYIPLLKSIEKYYAGLIMNVYSLSKLENSDDNIVFELVLEPLSHLKNSFWLILSRVLFNTNNLYASFFIEKLLIRYIEDEKFPNFLKQNSIVSIKDYVSFCCESELSCLAFAFPTLYCKLNIKKTLKLEELIKSSIERKIDGGKITYTLGGDCYKLKFLYRADSLVHEANISIPFLYPFKKARIEFDGNMKNQKFYHKLNELLGRTSKFAEIFLLWKIDIDNHLMGYSECLICYFIMEPVHRTLPGFKCDVCNNCFHEKCIYKWASESKRAHCPFCRSELSLWDK